MPETPSQLDRGGVDVDREQLTGEADDHRGVERLAGPQAVDRLASRYSSSPTPLRCRRNPAVRRRRPQRHGRRQPRSRPPRPGADDGGGRGDEARAGGDSAELGRQQPHWDQHADSARRVQAEVGIGLAQVGVRAPSPLSHSATSHHDSSSPFQGPAMTCTQPPVSRRRRGTSPSGGSPQLPAHQLPGTRTRTSRSGPGAAGSPRWQLWSSPPSRSRGRPAATSPRRDRQHEDDGRLTAHPLDAVPVREPSRTSAGWPTAAAAA